MAGHDRDASRDDGRDASRDAGREPVRAAGGVVLRQHGGAVQVLLIHRDRYDDWTLPKGKLDPGEDWATAAVREVFEETGIVAVLGDPVADTTYVDHKGRPKVVRYFAMRPAADVGFETNDEVTRRVWCDLDDARSRLTHAHDRDLLDGIEPEAHGGPSVSG